MRRITIIGVGNCGGQVALLAEKKYPEIFDSVYVNTSEADLSMITSENGLKFKIGKNEEVEGTGKNRDKMKEYLRTDIEKILGDKDLQERIVEKKYCFIISSAAGGTGSGSSPILLEFMRQMFPDTYFILVTVLPQIQATEMEQGNALEYLSELYDVLGEDTTYMVYDNETVADLPPTRALEIVNENIVEDIRVISGIDNFPTPYNSIDDADMETIVKKPGRLLVTRLTSNLTEKVFEDNNIDQMIIKNIKRSNHAETDRNKRTGKWGVITYFTDAVNKLYNPSFAGLYDFIGTPEDILNHNTINDKSETLNFMYLIISGLSPINDRATKMANRIEELKKLKADANSGKYVLSGSSILADRNKQGESKTPQAAAINPNDIFSKFGK